MKENDLEAQTKAFDAKIADLGRAWKALPEGAPKRMVVAAEIELAICWYARILDHAAENN